MWVSPENDEFVDELYLAGEHVNPGTYLRIGTNIRVELPEGGRLPGSLDGHVACYRRQHSYWGELVQAVVDRPIKAQKVH